MTQETLTSQEVNFPDSQDTLSAKQGSVSLESDMENLTKMPRQPAAVGIYLSSAGLSMLGNSIAGIVWPWLVLERTGSPSAAGFVAAAIAIPSLVFAYFGGNLIDTFGRKPMSIISDIISGLSVVSVILVDMIFGLNMTWFVIIGILGAVGDIPGMSARAALVGDISESSGKSVAQISGFNQALSGISFLVGPALAGVLMASLPIEQVLWITALCSLLAAFLTSFLRVSPISKSEDAHENAKYEGFAGWKLAFSYPIVRLLALDSFLAMALVMPYLMVLLPARFQETTNPGLYGAAMSAFAIGMMITSIIAGKIVTRPKWAWALGMAFYTSGFFFMGMLENQWLVIAGMGVSGLGGGIMNPLQMVLVTEGVPEQVRGRTFSIFMAISQIASPIGLVITSFGLAYITIYQTAWILAVIWAVFAIYLVLRGFQLLPNKTEEAKNLETV
ncbi:MAG: MFS transporter [Arcanobacterium sp.]|nr:MFS transporter [Arcanobacterium sp.]